jgi:3-hydroxymyristoyl/3-hydroxydecanoyl-(acyl carrier protein) dehydratase
MRYRFIDRVLAVDAQGPGTIRTSKVFPWSEDYLEGTFRRAGEVPSSLVLEALAAAGSLLLAVRTRWRAHGVLLKVARAEFRRPVSAGDPLIVEVAIRGLQGDCGAEATSTEPEAGMAQLTARGVVGQTAVVAADMLFLCVPMAWSFGPEADRVVTELLELIGLADARP